MILKRLFHKIVDSATRQLRQENNELKALIQQKEGDLKVFIQQETQKLKKVSDETIGDIKLILQNTNAILETQNSNIVSLESKLSTLQSKMENLEQKQLIIQTQGHFRYVHSELLRRLNEGKKLHFASYIVYDSTFGAHGIVDLMLKEPEKYDVKFVICPDVYRDMAGLKQYHKTKQFFIERYGANNVLDGYDEKTGEFLDWSNNFDIVYTANKYDVLVNKVHGIKYLSQQDLLPIFLDYGLTLFNWSFNSPENSADRCFYYKYFVNTLNQKRDLLNQAICPVDNIIVSGYSKMDNLINCSFKKHKNKTVLIAPHHTVKGLPGTLQISNFLQYCDFIPKLADLFPCIDFIFRPHPLLFLNLVQHGIWTEKKVDDYLKLIREKNITYSTEADYFHLYEECDAIIHDCGSFLGEWLFTGKPGCYVVDTEDALKKQLNADGLLCLKHYYIADSESKIIDFLKRIESDNYSIEIDDEIRERVMVNYPGVSEFIFNALL